MFKINKSKLATIVGLGAAALGAGNSSYAQNPTAVSAFSDSVSMPFASAAADTGLGLEDIAHIDSLYSVPRIPVHLPKPSSEAGDTGLGLGNIADLPASQPKLEDSYRVAETGKYGLQEFINAEENIGYITVVDFGKLLKPTEDGMYEFPEVGDYAKMINEASGDTLMLYVAPREPRIKNKQDRAKLESVVNQPVGSTATIKPGKIEKFSKDDNEIYKVSLWSEELPPISARNYDGIRFERRPKSK